MARAVSYLVLRSGGYADTPSDYTKCATRADVEAQLVDFGYLDNPGVHVFSVTKGEDPDKALAELVVSVDPYPDWYVFRGPRGGVQWEAC